MSLGETSHCAEDTQSDEGNAVSYNYVFVLYCYITLMLFLLKSKHVALKSHSNITQALVATAGLRLLIWELMC
jgi:hypothetical protein